jgi:hypothetical protein
VTLIVRENVLWRCHTRLEKFAGNDLTRPPLDVEEIEGNLLVAGGANALFHRLIGGTDVAAFSQANAYLGVGDSTTAAAAAQTDLQASSNKSRMPMEDGYPTHTDGTSTASPLIFRAVWADADATFVWNEWAIFNAGSGGRMLNRKVQSFNSGVAKPSTQSWRLQTTVSVA